MEYLSYRAANFAFTEAKKQPEQEQREVQERYFRKRTKNQLTKFKKPRALRIAEKNTQL
jgi:hypothetical protein